jgi:hypothetical protein
MFGLDSHTPDEIMAAFWSYAATFFALGFATAMLLRWLWRMASGRL